MGSCLRRNDELGRRNDAFDWYRGGAYIAA